MRILRAHGDRLGYKGSFTIYDDADSRRLVEIVCRELDIDTKKLSPRSILGQISQAKSRQQGPEEYRAAAVTIFDRRVADVFDLYQQRMVAANAMDFDDLLLNTVRLFRLHPDVLEHYRTRFTNVLIDEYQDTNGVQNALAVLLAGEHRSIVVVGDSDQSVYRFRGADISNILDFEQAFPDATVITLDQNFRSTQTILDAANAVITNNVSRKPKTLWTDSGEGNKVVRYRAEDEYDEAAWVAHEVTRLQREEGLRWGDVAVFYRTNAQSRALEEAMVRAEVPYKVVGGTKFYDRREVKDVMAYLRVLVNPDDEVSWRRIVNVPKRGVGETSVARLAGWSGVQGLSFGEAVARADEAGIAGKAGAALVGSVGHAGRPASAHGTSAAGGRERGGRAPPNRSRVRPTAQGPRAKPTGRPAPSGRGSWSRPSWRDRATAASSSPRGPSRPWAAWRTSTSWWGWPTSTGPCPSSSRRRRWWPTRISSKATGRRSPS